MISLLFAAAIASVDIVSEVVRQPQPDGLSGITRVDDGNYLAVDDTGGKLYSVRVAFDRKSGEIKKVAVTNEIHLAGVVDAEGVAWDPLRKTVWVADEKKSRIAEFDPRTGRRLSEVKMPLHFGLARLNREIESLAIAPNGLTMWTATEEAVDGDGGKATKSSGTVVRLQRFSRTSGKEDWKVSGQFAYVVDPMGGEPFRNVSCSGLSDLCVLPGGELVALEREFSLKSLLPTFRLRLYQIDLRGATDTGKFEHLAGKRFAAVGKKLLLDSDTGFAMYEGICIGPRLKDGSQTLLLISDGDKEAVESLMCTRIVP